MADILMARLRRWRALSHLLWLAGRWRLALLSVLVLLSGLLPALAIIATGVLVEAVTGAAAQGIGSGEAREVLLAVAGIVLVLGTAAVVGNVVSWLSVVLDTDYAWVVYESIARATLGTRTIAALEDPKIADELSALREAQMRGLLARTVANLCHVVQTRLRGFGAAVILFGFRWWVPLLLAVAWQLTNRVYLRSTERGVTVSMNEGAVRLRRAEYLRAIALEPATAKEVRVFGLGSWLIKQYADAWLDALGIMWQSRKANRALTAAATSALVVAYAMALGAIGSAAISGEISVAALFVLAQAAIATVDLGLVGDAHWWLTRSLGVAERVRGLRERLGGAFIGVLFRPAKRQRRAVAIHLKDVRFTYPAREQPTIDGLTLTIPAGQALAIVGENGVGKTTLIKLLCGLYEPDEGQILLDGSLEPIAARGRIGVIFQDFVRYHLPLRENVGFGHLPLLADEKAVEQALRDAGGAELLSELSQSWDTVLARGYEGGVDLSGGQWQRVALARALIAVRGGAGLLILDEPTANLDVRAESELFRRFLDLTCGVTTIMISHRLSSVRHADRIVVLHEGRVVEDGTHAALLRANGRYARMFTLQAERFAAQEHANATVSEPVSYA